MSRRDAATLAYFLTAALSIFVIFGIAQYRVCFEREYLTMIEIQANRSVFIPSTEANNFRPEVHLTNSALRDYYGHGEVPGVVHTA